MALVRGVSYRSTQEETLTMTEIDLKDTETSLKKRNVPPTSRQISVSSVDSVVRAPDFDASAGVTYVWKDLNVFSRKKRNMFGKTIKDEAHILKNVSGLCKSGQFLAIMGASGAGKTTLLNVLTFRAPKLQIKGDITINGRAADPVTIAGVSAYVQQLDLFTGVFTVREQLNFYAQLRIGKGVPQAERERRVDEVIKDLGLNKCANTLIGVPGRIKGISGGEKKRLAFACELITNPMMLLCDEPTSGLDSFMAQNVMAAMKKMTSKGKTVISTIHQPSSEVFAMFDRLLILAEGRVAFLGKIKAAHTFFERLRKPCPSNFNPGDHFIHTLAVRAGKEDECRQYIGKVCDDFRDHEGVALALEIEKSASPQENKKDDLAHIKASKSPYRSNWFDQFAALSRRSTYEIVRDPSVTFIKVATAIFFGFIFGSIYYQVDTTSNIGVGDVSGVLFIFITNVTFSNMFPVITIFAAATPLFLREHWNGLYRSDAYFLSRNIVELPIYVVLPATFAAVEYYMVGLRPEAQYFFAHMLVLILVANVAVSYGYMISCMAKDYNTALILSTPLLFPIFLFGGFYMQLDTIPVWLEWITYISWFNYGYESLNIIQWDNMLIYNFTAGNATVPFVTGEEVLLDLNLDSDALLMDVIALVILIVVFRILAFLFLVWKTYRK